MLGTAFFSPDTLLLVQSIVLGGVDENIARLCEEEDLFQSNSHESSTPNSSGHTDQTGGDGAESISFGQAHRKSHNSYRVRQYALASQPFADLLRTTDAWWLVRGFSATSATSCETVQLPQNRSRTCSEQSHQSTITPSSSVQSENTLSIFSTDPIVAASHAQPSGANEHPELQLYLSNFASSETTSTASGGGNGVGNGGNMRAREQRANGPLSRTTFSQLFLLALRRFGMLCVGLYRKIDLGDRNDRSKRY